MGQLTNGPIYQRAESSNWVNAMPIRTHRWCRLLNGVLAVGVVFSMVACSAVQAGTFEAESRRDLALMKRKVRAAQFLTRATFGPTIEQINALAERMGQIGTRRACEEWIDQQMALPPQLHHPLAIQMYQDDGYVGNEDGVWIQRYRWHAWWDRALRSDDQLRQRVAWALIQILVTSEDGAGFNDRNFGANTNDPEDPQNSRPRWLGPTKYYDLMVEHAFGNYRDLLEDVTYSPVMGIFLSHMRNRKTDLVANRFPDENYAREIMQLFTIGLYELHLDGRLRYDDQGQLIPTYDNDDIKEYAKVFTGLAFKPHPNANPNSQFFWGNDFEFPMQMFNSEHEPGVKHLLLGDTVGSEGDIIDGDADIAGTLDNLMSHPNVAPFISRRLIQRLVKANPSRAYIRRVARKFNNNGSGVKGDLAAVVKAILLDPEAWRGQRVATLRNPMRVNVIPRGTDYSTLAEPVLRYARLIRGLHAKSEYAGGYVRMTPHDGDWIQEPYKQPSVFSFFLPDYQPPGKIVLYQPSRRIPNGFLTAPEFQVKTAVTSNQLQNRYKWDLYNGYVWTYQGCRLNFNYDRETEMASTSEGLRDLIDELDLVFCCGTLPQDYKDSMHQVITSNTAWMVNNATYHERWALFRVQTAVQATVCSPFCAVTQ